MQLKQWTRAAEICHVTINEVTKILHFASVATVNNEQTQLK